MSQGKIHPYQDFQVFENSKWPMYHFEASVVRRPGQICLSKKAVTQCATGCQPIKPEPLLKKISFTCFKEDRVAEHYAKKAERGQKMTELAGRPTAFEAEVPQPMSCVPASNYL